MGQIAANRFTIITRSRNGRAARNLFDYVELERLESEYNLPFISVSQPTENTPAGRMMRRTLANMASFYTEQQSMDDGCPLQAILCNAGAQFQGPIAYSADGYEETFAGNCLGHFLLVNLLLDSISEQGRIVFTASGTHDPETMDGKMVGIAVEPDASALALDGKNGVKPISGGKRYTTSKLCVILYAYELNRRLRRSHSSVASIAFDPGFIPETGLTRTSPKPMQWLVITSPVKVILKMLGVTMGSVSFSGAALAKVVADPDFAGGSGKYFQSHNGSLIEARSSKMSYDSKRAAKLWSDSEQLAHLQASEKPALLH